MSNIRLLLAAMAVTIGSGCASAPPPPTLEAVIMEDTRIASDAGVNIYVRNKRPASLKNFSAAKTVLYVHGATYPSSTAFDLSLDGQSWMDYIARRGYDVWLVDVRGYGYSSRPAIMEQPANANPPFATTAEAARDVGAAVDHILKKRGIQKLNLIGWSWGTVTMALYTSQNNAKVNKLVLYAPVWLRTTPSLVQTGAGPVAAYRMVPMNAARQRWLSGVAPEKQKDLIPAGWFEAWADATWKTDPQAMKQNPPALRAPNGVVADGQRYWGAGPGKASMPYNAADIRVPTLLIKAEWDQDTPAYMAQALFPALTGAPYKRYIEIGEGTHTVIMEKNRMSLFREVQLFLDEEAK
jgi:pimeloyl-ACP methyl ester carboxylesterase